MGRKSFCDDPSGNYRFKRNVDPRASRWRRAGAQSQVDFTIKASSQADTGSAFQFLCRKPHSEKCRSSSEGQSEICTDHPAQRKRKLHTVHVHAEWAWVHTSTQFVSDCFITNRKDLKKSDKLRLVKSFSHFTKLHFFLNLEQNVKHLALNTSETWCITRNSLRIGSPWPPVTVWGTLGYFLRRIS